MQLKIWWHYTTNSQIYILMRLTGVGAFASESYIYHKIEILYFKLVGRVTIMGGIYPLLSFVDYKSPRCIFISEPAKYTLALIPQQMEAATVLSLLKPVYMASTVGKPDSVWGISHTVWLLHINFTQWKFKQTIQPFVYWTFWKKMKDIYIYEVSYNLIIFSLKSVLCSVIEEKS